MTTDKPTGAEVQRYMISPYLRGAMPSPDGNYVLHSDCAALLARGVGDGFHCWLSRSPCAPSHEWTLMDAHGDSLELDRAMDGQRVRIMLDPVHGAGMDNLLSEAEAANARDAASNAAFLSIALETLAQIATTPRNAGARRSANATMRFIQTQRDAIAARNTRTTPASGGG